MDTRTLREKLEAMAAHGTEHEREIAQAKLDAMGAMPPPPPPPTSTGPAAGGYYYEPPHDPFVREMHFYGPNGEHTVIRGRFTVNGVAAGTDTANATWSWTSGSSMF